MPARRGRAPQTARERDLAERLTGPYLPGEPCAAIVALVKRDDACAAMPPFAEYQWPGKLIAAFLAQSPPDGREQSDWSRLGPYGQLAFGAS